jgi:hypothetical protein
MNYYFFSSFQVVNVSKINNYLQLCVLRQIQVYNKNLFIFAVFDQLNQTYLMVYVDYVDFDPFLKIAEIKNMYMMKNT